MLGFYHSQPIYSVYYPGSNPRSFSPFLLSPSSSRPVVDPEVRYRRALADYLSAEEDYRALLRTREEARLRARVEEALHREEQARIRLRHAEVSRAQRGQQVREFEQALAKALSRAAVSKDDDSFQAMAPVIRGSSAARPVRVTFVDPHSHAYVHEKARDKRPQLFVPESDEHSAPVPNVESVVRDRLQEIVGDEEVQDVARAILRHLTPGLEGRSPASKENAYSTQPSEGADLCRSDALQGSAAEAAKESFKAHRAEVAEREQPSSSLPTSNTSTPAPLEVIKDIRSALVKLSSGFSFPSSLDFTDAEPDGLAYTPTNAPIRVYEHALDNLLARLDAVETDDDEVRVERRTAVKEVEQAIEDVERRVTEAREAAKLGGNVDAPISFENDLVKDNDEQVSVHAEPSEANDSKPSVDEPFPSIVEDDMDIDSTSLVPEASSPQNPQVVLRPQSSPPVLESIPHSVATPAPTTTDPVVASSVPTDEMSVDQVTTGQTTTPLEPSASAAPPESPVEVSTTILGAIAPSATPVSPTINSPDITEDLLTSLSRDRVSLSWGLEGEDESDLSSADADDEREWIEVDEV